jgi:hypothetical protein
MMMIAITITIVIIIVIIITVAVVSLRPLMRLRHNSAGLRANKQAQNEDSIKRTDACRPSSSPPPPPPPPPSSSSSRSHATGASQSLLNCFVSHRRSFNARLARPDSHWHGPAGRGSLTAPVVLLAHHRRRWPRIQELTRMRSRRANLLLEQRRRRQAGRFRRPASILLADFA